MVPVRCGLKPSMANARPRRVALLYRMSSLMSTIDRQSEKKGGIIEKKNLEKWKRNYEGAVGRPGSPQSSENMERNPAAASGALVWA